MFSPLRTTRRRAVAAVSGAALAIAGLTAIATPAAHAANGVPRFDHVVIVTEEIPATDSASGQTLTYSATGLPAGLSDFRLSVSPASGAVTAGSSASATVSTTAIGGLSGTVTCTVSGLPSGATASFSPTSFAVGSKSTLTLATAGTTAAGNYSITITCTSRSVSHSMTYTLTVNPVTQNTVTVTNPGNRTGTAGPRPVA